MEILKWTVCHTSSVSRRLVDVLSVLTAVYALRDTAVTHTKGARAMRIGALVPRQERSTRALGSRGNGGRVIWLSTPRSRLSDRSALRSTTHARSAGDRRPVRPGHVALIAAAVVSAAVGLWIMAARSDGPADGPVSAQVDGLAIDLHNAGWVPMDAHAMDSQGGFQMPAQMMPGAPAGDEMRLGIAVTLLNTADVVSEFNLGEEFVLVGGVIDGSVRMHSDTFGLLRRLGPGSGVNGVLYFDTTVPAAGDPALVLRWSRSGETVDVGIPLGSANPAPHPHAS